MILIVGGSCQGKAEFARSLLRKRGYEEASSGKEADGMTDSWQQAFEKTCLLNLHGFLRQVLEAGQDMDGFIRQILNAMPEAVTMDEVGCGIVPVEKRDRDYREAVGRAGQSLAAEAAEVYRMVCGVPVRIK